MKRKGITGYTLWHDRVQNVYSSLDDLRVWNRIYKLAQRCGFRSVKALWEANPMLQGSTNPADFGIAR